MVAWMHLLDLSLPLQLLLCCLLLLLRSLWWASTLAAGIAFPAGCWSTVAAAAAPGSTLPAGC